eukprot:6186662-Pleurochrysis_carterae.AAC.3
MTSTRNSWQTRSASSRTCKRKRRAHGMDSNGEPEFREAFDCEDQRQNRGTRQVSRGQLQPLGAPANGCIHNNRCNTQVAAEGMNTDVELNAYASL